MSEQFTLKVGDTVPSLQAVLEDGSGDPVNLTAATVEFHLLTPRTNEIVVSDTADLVDASNGVVRYRWADSDTDTVGRYRAEFVVTYPKNDVETFPNAGYHDVVIAP